MVSTTPFATYRATPHQREVSEAIGRLDRELPEDAFSREVRADLYRFALIRNGWGTTNIDSGPISLEKVEALYEAYRRGHAPAGQRIRPHDREVLNYFRLIDDLPTSGFAVSLEDLRLLHHDYFQGVPLQNDAQPGRWKTSNNLVAGPWGVLKTTPKDEVEADLERLLDWINGPAQDEPPPVRAAVFFHEFQRIHPFGDGNGRVGRLAALFLLGCGGLAGVRYCPIDDAINEDRQEYYRALRAADEGNLVEWVNYWLAQLKSGYLRARLLGSRLQRIPPTTAEDNRALLRWLYVHRVEEFRFADIEGFYLNLSRSTILRRLKDLETAGFLRREGRGQGSRYHVESLHALTERQGNLSTP